MQVNVTTTYLSRGAASDDYTAKSRGAIGMEAHFIFFTRCSQTVARERHLESDSVEQRNQFSHKRNPIRVADLYRAVHLLALGLTRAWLGLTAVAAVRYFSAVFE